MWFGGDLNGHVGQDNAGVEEVMGKFGLSDRNATGEKIVDFAMRNKMAILNTYFKKEVPRRTTYKSGGNTSQVDHLLCRRDQLKHSTDCTVLPGESVAKQHRLVICKIELQTQRQSKQKGIRKTKWWKLNDQDCQDRFVQKVKEKIAGEDSVGWEEVSRCIREVAKETLGESSGNCKKNLESWWWNDEVQKTIKTKKDKKKAKDLNRNEDTIKEYKAANKAAKRAVARAKNNAYRELYESLDSEDGYKKAIRIAKQKHKQSGDVYQAKLVKDESGNVLGDDEAVKTRWKNYFDQLMNTENERIAREVTENEEGEVREITAGEVVEALKKMKKGKAVGPDNIPAEAWKCLGQTGVEKLRHLFNGILETEKIPDEWRWSTLVPIYKNKGDIQDCGNYRGIKLISHTMKIWERVIDRRLRNEVSISPEQFGFIPGRSTTDAIFALRQLVEKYKEDQQNLHCIFIDLEKAYDRVTREEMWNCLREKRVCEKYVRLIQDMYKGSKTQIRCTTGTTEAFNVTVGVHQGSALSPLLFAIVMDSLTEGVRREIPWAMMIADDVALRTETKEEMERRLEEWKSRLEDRGMRVSRQKTEYLCAGGGAMEVGSVKMQGKMVTRTKVFKYLGSTVQDDGGTEDEIRKRIQAGWNSWRKVTGVLCDSKVSPGVKGRLYKMMVRPTMLYGMETVAVTKSQEKQMERVEMKMLRFSLGVTRRNRIRNEEVRRRLKVEKLSDKLREARLRWFGHVMRREETYVGKRVMEIVVGKRKRGRPRRRWKDCVKEDMAVVGVTEKVAEDRRRWRIAIRTGDPT